MGRTMVERKGYGPFLLGSQSAVMQTVVSRGLPGVSRSRKDDVGYLELPGKESMAFIDRNERKRQVQNSSCAMRRRQWLEKPWIASA
jgi:hypothetical protein